MAVREKQYIEPKDICGLRLVCEKCGTSQDRPLPRDPLKPGFEIASSLMKCPGCPAIWFNITDPHIQNQHRTNVNEFVTYLLSLWLPDATRNFRVELQIDPNAISPHK
jgi:hypothetical protein